MALKGTLNDMGLVALLQFPNSGRRTGLLTVVSGGRQAELYYVEGHLVHASLDGIEGQKVLVEMIDWTDGVFTFDSGITTGKVSIEQDLHRTIMWALKERDEVRKAQMDAQKASSRGVDGTRFEKPLIEFVDSSSQNLWACVLDPDGVIVARTNIPDDLSETAPELARTVSAMVSKYPGGPPERVIIEDGARTLGVMSLGDGLSLLAVVSPDTKIGLMCIALGRLVESIRKKE